MAEHDLVRDERLGAAIAGLPMPPEPEGFWDDLRVALREPVPEPGPAKRRRSGRERALVLGLAAIGLVVGGLITYNYSIPPTGEESCGATVVWHGQSYGGNDEHHRVRIGRPLGHGTLPSCGSSGAVTVKVYAIKGVSPSRAVAVAGQPTIRWTR